MGRRAIVLDSPALGSSSSMRRGFHYFFLFVSLLVIVFGLIWIYTTVEQFLVSSRRFILHGPPDSGASSSFRIEGSKNSSRRQITDVFLRDFGRSIYLCPIAERRRRLLAIGWVKEASVSRVWPNQIIVRVKERTPVAFVQVQAADKTTTDGLIDEDGVLLDPDGVSGLKLAVLTGIPASDSERQRRERVRRFLAMRDDLGQHMSRISEVDVGDVDNLKVIQPFDSHAITLMLGNQRYKERLENFLNNVDQIRQRTPNA
ncbi:MAG TPA: FtsQ-type POTRA domain-containing protein, partial [Bryobacteraceae bacterium]|nr:FtsQ-type POTRA domain-containing protein [Bryobacteraceae bacterium]